MMTKSDTIEAIQKLNPTARPDFLAGFPNDELARYLDRLSNMSPERPMVTSDEIQTEQLSVSDAAVGRSPL